MQCRSWFHLETAAVGKLFGSCKIPLKFENTNKKRREAKRKTIQKSQKRCFFFDRTILDGIFQRKYNKSSHIQNEMLK